LVFPELLLSAAITGNVHAFSLWAAAAGDFILYFLLSWCGGQLVSLLALSKKDTNDPPHLKLFDLNWLFSLKEENGNLLVTENPEKSGEGERGC
jgi:hypothetical protein